MVEQEALVSVFQTFAFATQELHHTMTRQSFLTSHTRKGAERNHRLT